MCLSDPMGPTGTVVGRFRIEQKLGDGPSGEIHRAVATEGGTVAIVHVVRADPERGGVARRDRLIRETKRAAQLEHVGLAKVLEVGVTDGGDMFVAVERIEDERLSDRLRAGQPLPEREAVEIAAQMARALAKAHDADVVHGNLRPSLVALSREGATTRVRVEGLATPRAPGASLGNEPELAYAAPEQRRGEAAGRRADVYSIGAMLRAMLTGRPPAPGAEAGIVGPLGDVVRRCLAEDPRERFLDTIALGAALRVAMESATPLSPASSLTAASTADRPPPSSRGQTPRPASVRAGSSPDASSPIVPSGRAPAAPPPRPLGRPLTARPRWEEMLIDLSEGPLPRVALTVVVAFVIARILTSGIVPFVVALAAGIAVYATKYWRGPRGDR